MTVMTHEPSTENPADKGIASRLLVPQFWGACGHRLDVARSDLRRCLRWRHDLPRFIRQQLDHSVSSCCCAIRRHRHVCCGKARLRSQTDRLASRRGLVYRIS